MGKPLIRLASVRRDFGEGEAAVAALDGADLVIEAGEMVAIVGQSGSGKSTLMNIIGCLDRPTGGSYEIDGRPTRDRDPDELARLRRDYFGFVFQRYHLLSELTALANVEVPAIYAGVPPGPRQSRAAMLLERLGLASRATHRPSELSGGQQQRVSVARAHRIIELSDGQIIDDRRTAPRSEAVPPPSPVPAPAGRLRAGFGRLKEAFGMAVRAMAAHKLRTTLTMLGIVIGIAAVVSVVALGEGAKQNVLQNISGLGTNTLEIFPGAGFGDTRSGRVRTLTVLDAQVLAAQPYAASVTPTVSTSATIRLGNVEASALVNGVSERYFDVRGSVLTRGSFFTAEDVRTLAQDVVIDENTLGVLFPNGTANPIGTVFLIGTVPSRIVGVMRQQQGGFGGSQNPQVFMP